MVVFLANRANLQHKRLHDRIQHRLNGEFENVRRRRAEPREAGPYRVVGEVNPRQFFDVDEYPVTTARIEIGFQLRTNDPYEHYWVNWIEPDRSLLVGWHQDGMHADYGPVHLQVNDGSKTVDHHSAQLIDSHPLDVVERRLASLHDAVFAVDWEQGRPIGLDGAVSE
jgi:hypothetical protein